MPFLVLGEALSFASNTLVGEERAVTARARERALELGRPVYFDAFLGTLLARLQAMDWDPGDDRLRDALADAAEAGARATESWGAVA
jgi:hypothetical protein